MKEVQQSIYSVSGSNGVPLNLREGGNPAGIPIVLLHGLGRCNLDWQLQFQSALADRYRLLAPDLRGHGNSGKPWQPSDYNESCIWADDLEAVLKERAVERPLFVAWSYGGVVALDYLRERGPNNVRGINFVGNVSLLARGIVPKLLSADHQSLDLEANIRANEYSVGLLAKLDLGEDWRREALLTGMATPAYVRQAIHLRDSDYTDVLNNFETPVMVTCGVEDPGYTRETIETIQQVVSHAAVSLFDGVGHAPFLENPDRFNHELHTFVDGLN